MPVHEATKRQFEIEVTRTVEWKLKMAFTWYPLVRRSFISLMMYGRNFAPSAVAIFTRVSLATSLTSQVLFLRVSQTFSRRLRTEREREREREKERERGNEGGSETIDV